MLAEPTEPKQKPAHLFKPGQSGNPAGRPLGSKNKLTEAFWQDFHAAWQELGPEALRRCAIDNPKDFCKIAAMLMPKEVDVAVEATITQVRVELAEYVRDLRLWRELQDSVGAEVPLLEAHNEPCGDDA